MSTLLPRSSASVALRTPELVGIAGVVRGSELLVARTWVARCPVATLVCAEPETLATREITQPELVKLRKTAPAARFR